MQFEPSTYAAYDHPIPADPTPTPGGSGSIYDPVDAIWAAARMLCANGAANPATVAGAIWAYNHDPAYVAQVLNTAAAYAATGGGQASDAANVAVSFALGEVGAPYVWGGDTPGGYDCSGLAQWAYAQAGIALPRTAQAQYDTGPRLTAGIPLTAGDLVFFGAKATSVEHVGIYIGNGEMVDAPHGGAQVRTEPIAAFTPPYVGATRPTT
jgi:cell wall-associated NlpC family hydrolase